MECLKMIKVTHKGVTHTVPCGKCAFCFSNKRSSWMFRIHHEMRTQLHKGYFLTLTYDEKHVKRTAEGRLSLRFRDVQLWLKVLRKRKYYVKYIIVGEYGSETKRPHYHALIWTDCAPEMLEKLWFRGRIHFGKLTMASAMYTLKYIIQPKQKDENGVERTRAQFSKGLGLAYLDTAAYNYHTFDYDSPEMFSIIDGKKVALPRYYRQKIFTKYQLTKHAHKAKWDSIRKRRARMRELKMQGISNTKVYMHALRVDHAKRIIENTKYGQSL
ncbi:replication initiator protein [Apis mellifera associated microvirus 35]|nr:replication initiator protein [Apis mellifera associated microvirus 35]